MQTRLVRRRFRRRIKKGQRQVEDLGVQAEKQIDQHLFRRFGRLMEVRRFVVGWLALMLLLVAVLIAQNISLSGYYQTLRTVPGGIYSEGLLGRFTNANPIYANSDADNSVARLIFAGLFTYDDKGNLAGDLARDYEVDSHGSTYTVHLKPGLKWQDGQPLTSDDVLFTYSLIQNPDVQSPLKSSWDGVIVTAPDPQTVVFKLPGVLAPFPYSLTNGIVPKHILDKIPVTDMRSADFNTIHPVGAGPFKWQAIRVTGDGEPSNAQEQIGLEPFADYQGGQPKLQSFVVRIFANRDQLVSAFEHNQLTAVEGLTQVPKSLESKDNVVQHSLPLRAANMVFFKTSEGVLADKTVRQALVYGTNVPGIISSLGYPARAVREPILMGQVGYDSKLVQPGFNPNSAKKLLDSAGWIAGKDGQRAKDGKKLSFNLTLANTAEYRRVASRLEKQWRGIGVKVNLQYQDSTDFQSSLTYHSYDAILYGISIGPDPDVFVYWDSSQADIRSANRLNLSEFKNSVADSALEAGRTRIDPSLRVIKYKPFLQAWQQDAPAVGLYQPRVLYLTNGLVSGLSEQAINTATDRFVNVQNWEIREAKVTN
jgi:peptide/nickel transport system substrate-binding protein